ncbi:MAG: xanthine dehydrogenase small subunit [Betaproteobacteria bacterium]|nr:MAG: xanthine dehydrogenase small subunit [Betaproteobacteria bacterium]
MISSTQSIRFLLNGAPHTVSGVNPHTTLLQYLREHLQLTGSKEGCAEGDCGACTVVLAEIDVSGELAINPINACIRLLPTLDGKAIFTVESLAGKTALHPVQQAMVNCHASQCGFCTPGFVMALFALFKNDAAPTRERACEALSGNLCRCTGYRPILDAAEQMYALASTHSDAAEQWIAAPATCGSSHQGNAVLIAALRSLERDTSLDYSVDGARFVAPRSVEEFSTLALANPSAWILGGGTDIGLWINKALQSNALILYTGEIAALQKITETDEELSFGAAVSLERAFRAMNRVYPELAQVWTRFASWPVRASGTLGGNVANGSPIGDSMPALIALGATVTLRKGANQRSIALESLYLGYKKQSRDAGEWIETITLPTRRAQPPGTLQIGFYKNSKRNEQDISAVCSAVVIVVDRGVVSSARIALGGMAGIPKRARLAEAALVGKAWSEEAVRAAMNAMTQDVSPMSDMRASGQYRMQVAQNHLLRFWHESQGTSTELRVF